MKRFRSVWRSLTMSLPSISIDPASGSTRPRMHLRRTLFPEPEAPSRTRLSPVAMSRSTPVRTCKEPKDFTRPRIRILGMLIAMSPLTPDPQRTAPSSRRQLRPMDRRGLSGRLACCGDQDLCAHVARTLDHGATGFSDILGHLAGEVEHRAAQRGAAGGRALRAVGPEFLLDLEEIRRIAALAHLRHRALRGSGRLLLAIEPLGHGRVNAVEQVRLVFQRHLRHLHEDRQHRHRGCGVERRWRARPLFVSHWHLLTRYSSSSIKG